MSKVVMPDLIRHPALFWISAFAGMTVLVFIVAGVIRFLYLMCNLYFRKYKPFTRRKQVTGKSKETGIFIVIN